MIIIIQKRKGFYLLYHYGYSTGILFVGMIIYDCNVRIYATKNAVSSVSDVMPKYFLDPTINPTKYNIRLTHID